MTNSERLRDSSVMMSSAMPSEKILLLRIAAHVGERQHGDRRLVWQRQGFPCAVHQTCAQWTSPWWRQAASTKALDRTGDVLQFERSKRLESQVEPVMHMIAHRPRDADATRRAFGLEPGRHDHAVAMQIGSVGNRVADIDPYAKADGPIGRVAPSWSGTCCCTFTAQRTAPSMLSNTISSESPPV